MDRTLSEKHMFAIGTRPDYRLPFTTVVVDQVNFAHTHRDRTGITWQEPMTLDIYVLAVRLDALPPADNDNECVMARDWE